MKIKKWVSTIAVVIVIAVSFPTVSFAKSLIRLNVDAIYQDDYTQALFEYNGYPRSVSSSGCGAACVSMVIDLLAPHIDQTPETLLLWAYNHELYTGSGLSINTLIEMLNTFELDGKLIGKHPKRIRTALRAGEPLIAYMGPGIFTNSGHYIVIAGIDKVDQVFVIDPNSKILSNQWYSLDVIFKELGNQTGIIACGKPIG